MKILIVRFSSIGDIVLTSSLVKAVKDQRPDCEIHYLTKEKFQDLVRFDPHLSKVYTIQKDIGDCSADLKAENYDVLIDLHNNLRTRRLSRVLGVKTERFPKLNWKKWLLVKFKIDKLPELHIVDRYFEAVLGLGIKNLRDKLQFYPSSESQLDQITLPSSDFLSIAIGAQFATKRMPNELLQQLISQLGMPVVLLGGNEDFERGNELVNAGDVLNLCGKLSLSDSARVVEQSFCLLTNDTGMMHIASAGGSPIVSVWGNTVPAFGMYPYRPKNEDSFSIHEVKDLGCRPCSKIGYQSCPKGHFKCMKEQNVDEILTKIRHFHHQRTGSLS